MSFRIVATPLAAPVPEPRPRETGGSPQALRSVYPAPGIEAQVARLGAAGALAVTSGQQPALFTGPLYTVHKALAAAALARKLEAAWGRPVVPVFWVAGDDHDWAEARSATWVAGNGELVTGALAPRPSGAPLEPLWRVRPDADLRGVLELLRQTLPQGDHRAGAVAWAERHFTPGRSLAAASGTALAELVAPFGVVCLDTTSPDFKEAMAPLLVRALEQGEELERDLIAARDRLAAADRAPDLAVGGGATLVMLDGPGGRDRLVRDGAGFATRRGGERWSLADLRALAQSEPTRLSPNVLLRPAIESALVPTVAYCAGPGELAYLPLAAPVFARLGVPRPAAVPRWSGVVLPARVDRALTRFGLSLEELLDPATDVAARAARDTMPPELSRRLAASRADLTIHYGELARLTAAVDPSLERSAEGAGRDSLWRLERLEHRVVRALKRRHATELRQLEQARNAVLPRGRPQERVLCVISLLARYGDATLQSAYREASAWYAAALEGRPVPA